MPHSEDIAAISARTGEGLEELRSKMAARLDSGARKVTLCLPYDQGGLLDTLYREAKVEAVDYGEAIQVTAVCPPKLLGQMQAYLQEA